MRELYKARLTENQFAIASILKVSKKWSTLSTKFFTKSINKIIAVEKAASKMMDAGR